MNASLFDNLIIFEMANNHMGDVEHGMRIIHEFASVAREFPQFRCAIKFQYRDLRAFIHPDFRNRMDLKYVKRFTETALSEHEFLDMKQEAENNGLLTLCTPFDEPSVEQVVKHGYQFLKIASCSFADWSLLECASKSGLPIIISTAGATGESVDKVVAFLSHRDIDFCLMHCIGAYPTQLENLEMNQIDYFRQRYDGIPIGFSTHESPEELLPAIIATSKGTVVFERHVGVPTDKYKLNLYSSTPGQTRCWLQTILDVKKVCGVVGERRIISEKEADDLRGLLRGAFLKHPIKEGQIIREDDYYLSIPCQPGQLVGKDLSKYISITARKSLSINEPLLINDLAVVDNREKILEIVQKLIDLIHKSGIHLQNKLNLEISYHYGIDNFYQYGGAIFTVINREYCKKIILLLPGQIHPAHSHVIKIETYNVLYGDLILTLNGVEKVCHAGDVITIEPGVLHQFSTSNGTVFEEISTTYYKEDSHYVDPNIAMTENRKTFMTFYQDWLTKECN